MALMMKWSVTFCRTIPKSCSTLLILPLLRTWQYDFLGLGSHEVQRDDGCLAFVDDEDNNDDDQDDYWKDDADNAKEEDDDTDHILLGLHRLHAQLRHRLLEGERLRIVIVVMVMIMTFTLSNKSPSPPLRSFPATSVLGMSKIWYRNHHDHHLHHQVSRRSSELFQQQCS